MPLPESGVQASEIALLGELRNSLAGKMGGLSRDAQYTCTGVRGTAAIGGEHCRERGLPSEDASASEPARPSLVTGPSPADSVRWPPNL
jgi:hypothetical protein